jgi:hypothetical protein
MIPVSAPLVGEIRKKHGLCRLLGRARGFDAAVESKNVVAGYLTAAAALLH